MSVWPPDSMYVRATLSVVSSGLAGEVVFYYELAEAFAPQLLERASEDFWQPIILGAAENEPDLNGILRQRPSP